MSETPAGNKRGLYQNMLAGSLWALALRWGMHGIGLASIAILARLLTPADFGIMAMAALVAGLIDVFTHMGAGVLLLRMREVTRADCDTAWTIGVIQGACVATLLVALSPFAVRYFSEPKLYAVFFALAGGSIIGSASNIGMILVRRELDFAKDFRFNIYMKLVSFLLTVALAYALRDYRALVVAQLIGTLLGVAISYRMHPYRPWFSLEKFRQYLSFSVGMLGWNAGRFLKTKIDVLTVGGTAGTAVTGSYNVASELASMSTHEVVVPIWRGLFPTFATIVHDRERFIPAYGYFVSTMAILCFPLGLGLSAVAEEAVLVILGAQWTVAIAPLKWLAVGATILGMIEVFGGQILFVTGQERKAALLMWVHLALLLPAVLIAARLGGVEEMAIATTLVAAVQLPVSMWVMVRSIQFPAAVIWRALWRPAIAVAVMLLVLVLQPAPGSWPPIFRLAERVSLGAAVYVVCLAVLWVVGGRPAGPEHVAWRTMRRILGRG